MKKYVFLLDVLPAIPLLMFLSIMLLPHGVCLGSESPSIDGCPVFPGDNIWNAPVEGLPVSSSSSSYISAIGASKGLHPDFGSGLWNGGPIGIPFNIVSGTQPKVGITFQYEGESDAGPYPVPSGAEIEGGSQSTGDRHVLVLDRDSCLLYELYSAYPLGNGSWEAGSGAIFDLRDNKLRQREWTSADAAGLPILPGLVRYDEISSGEIRHAIRFTAPQTQRAYVWPARHFASDLASASFPPMGQRFRLKQSFDISGFSPQVQVLLRGLKKYGMILADNGSSWYLSGVPDSRWDNNTLVLELGRVHGYDFEAVDASALKISDDSAKALATANTDPPRTPVRLIFIHHSTGENWLADGNGGLGAALRDNNYFVSDTNYGWGPDSIGNNTDIGNWWNWFRSSSSTAYLAALYAESGQYCSYSRLSTTPAGQNEIIMFKSCFPNSALRGNPDDPVPAIGSNPLRGQDSGSEYHTVANARGIYIDLLNYFSAHQEKLFVVISAPPLTDTTYAANARAFNQWLVNDWLGDYPYRNVAVFDFYNILTTNGGDAETNDLGLATGNHHRWWNGAIQHKIDGDDDPDHDVLEYPSGDDHPSRAGNLKATSEFVTLLNIFYNNWKSGDITPPDLSIDPVTSPVDVTTQTITGTVEAGATVTVATDTIASDGTATVTGSAWSYTVTGLAAGPNGITVTARDAANNTTVRTASITRRPRLTVAVSGSGGGTVTSSPAGIGCGTDCSASFDYNSTVTLSAGPAEFSLFTSWSGDCSGAGGCAPVMNSDRNVTATFEPDTGHMACMDGSTDCYPTLQAAYNGAPAGGVIKVWGTDFTEDLTAGLSKSVTILGGYDGGYTANNGYTTLHGIFTLNLGSVTVERLVIH